MTGQTRASAILSVTLGALVIGFAPIALRLSEVGPQATGMWRYVFALPLLIAMNIAKPSRAPPPRNIAVLLVLAGLAFGLDIAFWYAGLLHTSVVNCTLLSNLTPVFAALAGVLLFRERPGWQFVFGLTIGLAGALLLSLSRNGGAGGNLSGDIMSAISAVWYAAYLVLINFARRTISVSQAMLWTTASAILVALPAALIFGEALFPRSLHGWLILIGLGAIVHACGQGLIANGLGKLPLALSTVLLWCQPVAAGIWSWLLFGEAIPPLGLLGGALLLVGVFIVQMGRVRDSAQSAA